MRTFLAVAGARGVRGPVKWQFVGPVTLGVALTRIGVAAETAFAVAGQAVRAHITACATAVADALPDSPQIVVLDEPWFGDLMHEGFPIAPDPAIDLLSGAMATLEPVATVGVHCCAAVDLASLLAAGPDRALGAGERRARRGGRVPRPLPRGWWPGRVGNGVHRRSDPDEQ